MFGCVILFLCELVYVCAYVCVCITACVCLYSVCASTSDVRAPVRAPKTEVTLRFSTFGCEIVFVWACLCVCVSCCLCLFVQRLCVNQWCLSVNNWGKLAIFNVFVWYCLCVSLFMCVCACLLSVSVWCSVCASTIEVQFPALWFELLMMYDTRWCVSKRMPYKSARK